MGKSKEPVFRQSLPNRELVEQARASTPGPPTLECFMVTSYNAGMDAKTSHSATYEEAIRTLADRLTILMSTAHVVCVNELNPAH